MCPSYRLVVMFIRPTLDSPKSVSLMWPMEVTSRLWSRRRTRGNAGEEIINEKNETVNRYF